MRRPDRRIGFVVVLAVALGAVSCAPPSNRYVDDGDGVRTLTLPAGWRVFSAPELAGLTDPDNEFETAGNPVTYHVAFSADPAASADEMGRFTGQAATGMMIVFALTPEEQDTVSLRALRNRLFPVDTWHQEDPNSVVVFEKTPLADNGYRGERLVFSRRGGSELLRLYADSYTVNQTAYLDPTGERAYFLLVGCASTCYDDSRPEIDAVVASWSVTS